MLYLTGSLVQMSRAENPVLNFPPVVRKIQKNMKEGSKLGAVMGAYLFRPEETGKKASSRDWFSAYSYLKESAGLANAALIAW